MEEPLHFRYNSPARWAPLEVQRPKVACPPVRKGREQVMPAERCPHLRPPGPKGSSGLPGEPNRPCSAFPQSLFPCEFPSPWMEAWEAAVLESELSGGPLTFLPTWPCSFLAS